VLKSMTGYGVAEGPVGEGQIGVEIRTVNHRHFNSQFRMPSALQPFEADLKNRLREKVERGHAAVTIRWTQEPTRPLEIKVDLERARAVMDALESLKGGLELEGSVDLGFLARQPDVLMPVQSDDAPIDVRAVTAVLDAAVVQVLAAREREGRELGKDLEARLSAIEESLASVEAQAPERLVHERDRLRNGVAELLDGHRLDEDRLAQEIAIMADRMDITEEIVRLQTHLGAFREALAQGSPAGRQLAFLGQEMLREINTIGSKANDAIITQRVIHMKGEVEKIREQVENIE
jgi:uncharacterized protein (TIGR00255 family)